MKYYLLFPISPCNDSFIRHKEKSLIKNSLFDLGQFMHFPLLAYFPDVSTIRISSSISNRRLSKKPSYKKANKVILNVFFKS